jgi:hypothetical protein
VKKKVNLHAQQKLQAAHFKKLYMERLRKLCTLIGNGKPLFDLLPQHVLDIVYANRGVIRIKVADNVKITKRFVKIMYCHLEKKMKEKQVDLMIYNVYESVSFADYQQILIPLEGVLMLEKFQFKGKEQFDDFSSARDERYEGYCQRFMNTVMTACYTYGNLSKRSLYTFKYDVRRKESGLLHQTITLGTYPLGIRYVDIRGDRRPVIQTGNIAYTGTNNEPYFSPITVSLRQLHEKDPSGKKTVPVYIQQHAIDRTMQRACCAVPGSVPSLIQDAFKKKRRVINEGDRYLVECYFHEIKLGYFVGILTGEIFVILTFLFVTQSGTPEGRKLARITGLKRDDMIFLAIDDLKTLVNSDITKDSRIIKIFTDAGCESILRMNHELHDKGYYGWLKDDSKQNIELSKLIAEYIQLGDDDKEYFENE